MSSLSRDTTPVPARTPPGAPVCRLPGDLGAGLFVGACWAGMLLATLWLACVNGFRYPWMDDFKYIIPVLSGEQPLTLGWLWEQYTDARIPFAKLMNLALLWVSGWDYRGAAVFNVLALGVVAFGLIWVAARLRGRPSAADAAFPLILLCWAGWENLVWALQLFAVLSHVVLLSLLLLIASRRAFPSPLMALIGAGAVALLPVLGPSTLAYVPALVVWLLCLMVHLWRAPRRLRGTAMAVVGCGAAAVGLVTVYFKTYELYWVAPTRESFEKRAQEDGPTRPVDDKESQADDVPAPDVEKPDDGFDWLATLKALVLLASMALTTDTVSLLGAAEGGTPLYVYVGTALLAFYVLTTLLLAWVCCWHRAERLRAAGLLLFLIGAVCLFLAMSLARPLGLDVLQQQRYALFAMPPLLCGVLAWVLYGPRHVTALVQVTLFSAVCVLFPLNAEYGWRHTAIISQSLDSFAQDLVSGKPSFVLANHHLERLIFFQTADPFVDEKLEEWLAKQFRGLRERGITPFDGMAPDPDAATVALGTRAPAAVENIEWDDDTAKGQDISSSLTFTLPRPRHVLAVRVRYTLETDAGLATAGQAVWQDGGDGAELSTPLRLVPTPSVPGRDGRWTWIWIDDRIDRFRLHPDEGPFELRVEEVVLLIPSKRSQEGVE